MLYDDVDGVVRVLVVGPLAYVWLIVVLRISGKRTLAQLNAFDFIVTVALGSTLATVLLSNTVSWVEGALALALLAVLQLVLAWTSVHVPGVRDVVTSPPSVLLRDGKPDRAAMARQRVTEESVRQAVRGAGIGDLDLVAAVVLEGNGSISVIPAESLGSGSAMPGPG